MTERDADDVIRGQLLGIIAQCDVTIALVRQRALTHPQEPPRDIEPLLIARADSRRALARMGE